LTIPSVLVCGPLLGYGIASVLIKNGLPSFILPFFVGAGSILALVQVFRTAKIIARLSEETKND
jgi:hypothetical protein